MLSEPECKQLMETVANIKMARTHLAVLMTRDLFGSLKDADPACLDASDFGSLQKLVDVMSSTTRKDGATKTKKKVKVAPDLAAVAEARRDNFNRFCLVLSILCERVSHSSICTRTVDFAERMKDHMLGGQLWVPTERDQIRPDRPLLIGDQLAHNETHALIPRDVPAIRTAQKPRSPPERSTSPESGGRSPKRSKPRPTPEAKNTKKKSPKRAKQRKLPKNDRKHRSPVREKTPESSESEPEVERTKSRPVKPPKSESESDT
jgi:hypothetical protein